MQEIYVEYKLVSVDGFIKNPKELLEGGSITATVDYLAEIDFYHKLVKITWDEQEYTQQQILDALVLAEPKIQEDSGLAFYQNLDNIIYAKLLDNLADLNFDCGILNSFYTPKTWVKAVSKYCDNLPPYYVSRTLTNQYDAMDETQQAAFESQFTVGEVNRWEIVYNFILDARSVFQENPADWDTWDTAHSTKTKAILMTTLETIVGWNN